MTALLLQQLDYLLLIAGTLLIFGLLHRLFWKGRCGGLIPPITWLLVLGVLGSGWFFVEASARREGSRLRQMVEGYAPTYAQELGLMGHEQITPETAPDDPRYLQMIEAEKRWLAANPSVNDIYTFRKLADGHVALIVDSETDYDRDGQYAGEREGRTAIGENYDADLAQAIDSVLAGNAVFQDTPYTDRWGTWMSAMAPVRNSRGVVESGLGVDFDATTWVAAMERARLTAIGYIAAFLLVVAGGSGLLVHQIATRDLQMQLREQEGIRIEKKKLETLVNSIDGIVWEADARTFEFTYISAQSVRLLGYTPGEWMADADFWRKKLHPEDQWAYDHCAEMVGRKVPYWYDYRMVAADGRTVWIRESAAVLLDDAGEPLLVRGVFQDITEQKRAAAELEQTNLALVASSRMAGMAEVATGVLHNVGNVLNSVNVSAGIVAKRLRNSKAPNLARAAALLTGQNGNLAHFLTDDPGGQKLPGYLAKLGEHLIAENTALLGEVDQLGRNIEHIKEVVTMQQSYAKVGGAFENLPVDRLIEDAIAMNYGAFERHGVALDRRFAAAPPARADRHKVLQILINLLRNARYALDEVDVPDKRITITIEPAGEQVRIAITDNGVGIPAENLARIFGHGFTTRKTGHGFGLHSSALAAKEMGGTLTATSAGLGCGSTFTIDLQAAPLPTQA